MLYCETVLRKEFTNEVSKQAYLDACKWLAKNVYSKVELSKLITVKVEKQELKKGQLPTFIVTLYATYDEEGLVNEYCHKCKQLHSLLYSVEKPKCDLCKMLAFRKQKHDNLAGIKTALKETIMKNESDD
jgi:hypothetical protein